jgi:predicted alpha/beta superfamily hydrolase
VTAATSALSRHEGFHSTWLDADRDLTVFVPAGYPGSAGPYPLLLLHDGQNLFDPARAFGGETWHVAETADAVIAAGTIPPLVIAGVDHGREARVREYTPTAGTEPGAGQVGRHARFLTEEVVPFLARQYAVRTDVDGLGLGGSSLGGLATVAVALATPGRFGRLIVMSPSVWWDRRAILRRLRRTPLEPVPRTWIDVGLKEGAKTVRDARDLADLLRRRSGGSPAQSDGAALGQPPDDRTADHVRFVIDPEGDHSERSWARRFGAALGFCYGLKA